LQRLILRFAYRIAANGKMSDDYFNIDRLGQTHARTQMFRDVGEQLVDEINAGKLFHAPGSVARLLEKAFRAGIAFNSLPKSAAATIEDRRPQYLVEDELPYIVLECLVGLKHGLGWDREARRYNPTAEGLVLIAIPDDPDFPKKLRGGWFNSVSDGRRSFSKQAVERLIKLGLFQDPVEMDDGGKVTQMTEWGYELFRLTATRAVEDRIPGASRTFSEYSDLTTCSWLRLYLIVAQRNGFDGEYVDSHHVPLATSPRF
jgi:hypothetical protein